MFLTSYSKQAIVEYQISLQYFTLFHSHLEKAKTEKIWILFPFSDEELVQSLTRTKDLLEAVWQQNYHDYSYNSLSNHSYDMASPGGLVNRPGNYRNFNDLAQTSFQFSGIGVRPILKTSHSSYLLPPPELPPPPPPPLLTQTSNMPPPFPNLPG